MKSIEEIKNEVAVKNGYGKYFSSLTADEQAILLDEVVEEYAKQKCYDQINACGEHWLDSDDSKCYSTYDTIISTPNVVFIQSLSNGK